MNLNNISVFIFDVDGTLASTNRLIFNTFNHISLKYLNKYLSDREIIALFGPPEKKLLEKLFPENIDEVSKDYFDFYENEHYKLVEVFPIILESIKVLKNAGKKLAIFTGKGRQTTEITLNKLGLNNSFEIIVTGDDVKNYKPDPEGIIKILNFYDVKKDNAIMFGDSSGDGKAAKDSGIFFGAFLWDSFSRSQVLNLKPDFIFTIQEDFKEFISNLKL